MMKKTKKAEEPRSRGAEEFFSRSGLLLTSLIAVTVLLGFGCQPNQTVLKDVAPPPTPMETVEVKKTSLEEDLTEMRTANFGFIFVFRRKDGGVFDKDDQKFLRENTPPETNRWRRSDEGKAFIAGSGFAFTPDQLAALRSRFNIEDFSSPQAKEAANRAFNGQTNAPVNSGNANSSNSAAINKNSNKPVKP